MLVTVTKSLEVSGQGKLLALLKEMIDQGQRAFDEHLANLKGPRQKVVAAEQKWRGAAENFRNLSQQFQINPNEFKESRDKSERELRKASQELVAVKEELVAEKQEKLQLSRELLTLQLSASEQNASQQQHTHVLEQVRAEL